MPVVRSRFYEQKFPEVCTLLSIVSLLVCPSPLSVDVQTRVQQPQLSCGPGMGARTTRPCERCPSELITPCAIVVHTSAGSTMDV